MYLKNNKPHGNQKLKKDESNQLMRTAERHNGGCHEHAV